MNCLLYSLYIIFLVYTEDLYCYTFVVIGAFPNVTKPAGGQEMLRREGRLVRKDVGGR